MKVLCKISCLLASAMLVTACGSEKKNNVSPWGSEEEEEVYDLDEILASGGMIAVTLNGPDTYYDYRGSASGTQYKLCELFAKHIGVPVRMEVCRDTAELVRKISDGSADIIACTIDNSADSAGTLRFCGVSIKDRGRWAVNKRCAVLADSLDSWFRPSLIQDVEHEQRRRLRRGHAQCNAQPQIMDRSKGIISKYDNLFMRYAPSAGLDWHLVAAQCYQESCFDPNARSWAGACGLMQLMPGTAHDLGLSQSRIFNPGENIRAGIKYMGQLRNKFKDIPANERIKFALASYNGGYLHIRDAMALAEQDGLNSKSWAQVSRYVLKLSDPRYYNRKVVKYGYMRGSETVEYVNRIMTRWSQYRGIQPRHAAKK